MIATKKTIRIKTALSPRVFGDELLPEVFPGGLITCRVCDRTELVPIGHPALLCSACMTDLSATAAHVAAVYGAALAFFIEAGVALTEAVDSSPESAWWARVEAVRGADTFDAHLFSLAWERAKATGGERARLCALWEKLDQEAGKLEPLNAWYTNAGRELRAARAAFGEPIEA